MSHDQLVLLIIIIYRNIGFHRSVRDSTVETLHRHGSRTSVRDLHNIVLLVQLERW